MTTKEIRWLTPSLIIETLERRREGDGCSPLKSGLRGRCFCRDHANTLHQAREPDVQTSRKKYNYT